MLSTISSLRRLPVGTEITPEGVHFRVWAPKRKNQDANLVRRLGVDALWNDDFHHGATVALTGRNEAYYTDYLGTAQELVSAERS